MFNLFASFLNTYSLNIYHELKRYTSKCIIAGKG